LNQGDVAQRAGMTPSFINQIERGVTSPSIDSPFEFSPVLDVPVLHFLLEPETKGPAARHHERVHTGVIALPTADPNGLNTVAELVAPYVLGKAPSAGWPTCPTLHTY
jgi:transcriptional regulator with XRE-family HTH domain